MYPDRQYFFEDYMSEPNGTPPLPSGPEFPDLIFVFDTNREYDLDKALDRLKRRLFLENLPFGLSRDHYLRILNDVRQQPESFYSSREEFLIIN